MPIVDFGSKYSSVKPVAITVPFEETGIPDAEGLISYCARVSSPQNQDNWNTANKLLDYCARNKHWSVFDMANVVLEVRTTRDIMRQILRHSSILKQEFSQRYAEADSFVVRECRMQDNKNRQNSLPAEDEALALWWNDIQQELIERTENVYRLALDRGIAKEQARAILPEGNTMSVAYFNGTVRSWMHYCQVRREAGVTQAEHVDVADKVAQVLQLQLPSIAKHFEPKEV